MKGLSKGLAEWAKEHNQIDGFILRAIMDEYIFATSKFGKFNSAHEGLGVIWEEFEELKKEVFKKKEKRAYPAMYREATQLATMAIRFMNDICLERKEETKDNEGVKFEEV